MSRHRSFRRRGRASDRQGVILLVVLTVLVLFTLVAVTFVVVATQENKAAKAEAAHRRYDDGHEEIMHRAAMQVFAGTTYNSRSIMGAHSLLEDLYGGDGLVGRIPSSDAPYLDPAYGFFPAYMYGGGALMFFDVQLNDPPGFAGRPFYSLQSGYYNGRVITMLDGQAAGQSTRIVGYLPNVDDTNPLGIGGFPLAPRWARFLLVPFETMTQVGAVWSVGAPAPGDRFLINGRPFNGAGAGVHPGDLYTDGNGNGQYDAGEVLTLDRDLDGVYDPPGSVTFNEAVTGREYALLPFPPNEVPYSPVDAIRANWLQYLKGPDGGWGVATLDDNGDGVPDDLGEAFAAGSDDVASFDEDYDAPDFNNMLLAARVWDGGQWRVTHPSLVRPDLVHYWITRLRNGPNGIYDGGGMDDVDLTDPANATSLYEMLSRIYPRPLHMDTPTNLGHREFFANPWFDMTDLVTDGNGNQIPDSVERLYADFDGNGYPDVQYDVDCDGDLQADAVWVDLGLPVQTAPDGRQYKPLVAMLVLDLDGRLNINVHGNVHHYRALVPGPGEEFVYGDSFAGPYAFDAVGMAAMPPASIVLPRGSGYSVGDVHLGAILPDPYTGTLWTSPLTSGTVNEYRFLLQGIPPMSLAGPPATELEPREGRYGEGFLYYDGTGRYPMPGITSSLTASTNGLDGTAGTLDDTFDGDDNWPVAPMSAVSGTCYRLLTGNYYLDGFFQALPLGNYGTPGDVDSNGCYALDLRGQPYWQYMGSANAPFGLPEGVDDPPEFNAAADAPRYQATGGGARGTIDAPFTAADFEPLIRPGDVDYRALPERIPTLAPQLAGNPLLRGCATFASFDLPTPGIAAPPELRNLLAAYRDGLSVADRYTQGFHGSDNLHVSELLAARLILGHINQGASPWPDPRTGAPLLPAQQLILNNELGMLLAPELASGLRLDVNRPLGNGRDDDGDGLIDEWDPYAGGETDLESLWNNISAATPGVAFDHNGDGVKDINDVQARHFLARHLYVLGMLLTDSGYMLPAADEATGALTAAQKQELQAYRVAQWAVNVVDFRDRDSVMTGFEFDWRPFDDGNGDGFAWDVDGWVGTNPGLDGTYGTMDDSIDDDVTANAERRIVWGAESPDLLITEAGAGHDKRLVNEQTDDDDANTVGDAKMNMMPDDDYDQARIPQGWAFFELYSARNPTNPAVMAELYNAAGQLELGRLSPAKPAIPGVQAAAYAYPVWKLAISENRRENPACDVLNRLSVGSAIYRPDRTTLQPEQMQPRLTTGFDAADQVEIERVVWFSIFPPAADTAEASRIYYNQSGGAPLLNPDHYAVVGPARFPTTAGPLLHTTKIGHEPGAGEPNGSAVEPANYSVDPVAFTATDNDQGNSFVYPGTPGQIKPPIGIPVAGDPTIVELEMGDAGNMAWTLGNIGLSLSEPMFSSEDYYDEPIEDTTDPHDGTVWTDRYFPPQDAMMAVPVTSRDEPLDKTNDEIENDLETATLENDRTAFLQRLADPTLPWNPLPEDPLYGIAGSVANYFDPAQPVNPYLTVDWTPVDLTVYNGETEYTSGAEQDPEDPNDSDDTRFGTRQRGQDDPTQPRQGPGTAPYNYNLWKPGGELPPQVTAGAPDYPYTAQTQHYFQYQLDHTLGYLNRPFHHDPTVMMPPNTAWIENPDPYGGVNYVGDPWAPFPWLTWNNRPYTSAQELLLVPASGPGRLLWDYDFRRTPGLDDHYAERDATDPAADAPFPHLLNLFRSGDADPLCTAATAYTNPTTGAQANYFRLLEFVTVPSRMSGTEDLLNPVAFQVGSGANVPGFSAPYNRVSRFRDPGRININTIFDDGRTLAGALGVPLDPAFSGPLWIQVVRSRRGYDPTAVPPTITAYADAGAGSVATPTVFANPFRGYSSEFNVPLDAMRFENCNPAGTRHNVVDATIARPHPADDSAPLFGLTTGEYYRNSDRNPAFRYQLAQKLGNTLTTRSNVYAVWITVGFFEVQPVAVDAAHPDGYTLGAELGSDTGEVTRHRAFYLFDRSIPVGFARGQDLNVEKAILLRRVIE
jgi:hypothetical protein